MILKEKFYNEILKKELEWEDLASNNLLNVYYLPVLSEFYFKKKNELEKVLETSDDQVLKDMKFFIDNIINRINESTSDFRINSKFDINYIISGFFTKNYKLQNETVERHIKQESSVDEIPDYLYEEFDE